MRVLPQEDHADLGIVDDDNTPDMRKASAATEALRIQNHPRSHHNHTEEL